MNLDSCQLNVLTFGREEVMKHIPPRCYRGLHTDWKVTVWDSSIDPLPHQPTKKHWLRPLPLTQHLSPLHTERLSFLFALSYYYYQGNFEVARWHSEFHCLSMMAAGFHSTFLTGGGDTPTAPAGGGGISHGCVRLYRNSWARPSRGMVCLSAVRF